MCGYFLLPRCVLPVELLHGLTFACGWGAGCEKSKALVRSTEPAAFLSAIESCDIFNLLQAPPGLEATQQGVFQGLYFGLGYGLGALAGGAIAGPFGFQTMYLCGAAIVSGGWALSRLGRFVLAEKSAKGHYSAVAVSESSVEA